MLCVDANVVPFVAEQVGWVRIWYKCEPCCKDANPLELQNHIYRLYPKM